MPYPIAFRIFIKIDSSSDPSRTSFDWTCEEDNSPATAIYPKNFQRVGAEAVHSV